MTYGLTSTGFVPKTLTVCKGELEDQLKAAFGASILLDPQSVFGQFVGVIAEREALLWEALEDLDHADDPDGATGASLDKLCAITGTIRNPAKYSTVLLTCAGTAGTYLAVGREVSVLSTGYKFSTITAATLTAVSSWLFLHSYSVGDRITNGGKVYQCTTGGTSAPVTGPTGTGTDITDGSVHWRYLGSGNAAADVIAQSVDLGPVVGVAFDLSVIETPVSGWNAVTNFQDAVPGAYVEGDPALRIRRENELTGSSNAALDAVRAKVLKVANVTACFVFENTTMVTDVNGLPPKSIEVLAQGGADQAVADAVFAKAAGIETYGTTTMSSTDSAGASHTVKFSRPNELDIWVKLWITKDPSVFPANGAAQIQEAVAAKGLTYQIGKDVTSWAMSSVCAAIDGVLEVTQCYIGLSNPPLASTTITCGNHDLAVFDTSRVILVLADGSP